MKTIDDTLLTEFLEGKLDETTQREIETWYDASPANRQRLEALYLVLFASERLQAAAAANPDEAIRAFRRRIEMRRQPRPGRIRALLRYAAVLAAGMTIAIGGFLLTRPEAATCSVYAETSDCSVTLPDGSTVRLTRRSQLDYPASWNGRDRTVHLTGEAFFDIRKRGGAPFTVTTAHDAEVVVRGTRFNLKAYTDCSDVETVLVDGAVDFRTDAQSVTLKPGQKVSYNPADRDITVQNVHLETELAARLRTFRHVELERIAAVIDDYYGFKTTFRREALRGILFTGTLDFDSSIDHILEVLTLSTDTRFSRSGNRIDIYR